MAGLALALVLAVVAPLVWAVVAESSRLIPIVAPAALVSTWAVAAVGSLFLVRRRFDVEVVAVLLVAVIAGTVVGALVERLDTLPFGDPFSATALTTILATVVAAAIWSLDLSTFLFTGVVVALGMVGGRGLGTVLRLRRPSLVERAPGWLTAADGPVLAAGLYYPVVSILG